MSASLASVAKEGVEVYATYKFAQLLIGLLVTTCIACIFGCLIWKGDLKPTVTPPKKEEDDTTVHTFTGMVNDAVHQRKP